MNFLQKVKKIQFGNVKQFIIFVRLFTESFLLDFKELQNLNSNIRALSQLVAKEIKNKTQKGRTEG